MLAACFFRLFVNLYPCTIVSGQNRIVLSKALQTVIQGVVVSYWTSNSFNCHKLKPGAHQSGQEFNPTLMILACASFFIINSRYCGMMIKTALWFALI